MTDQNEQKQEQQIDVNAYRMQLQIQNLAQRNAQLTAQISALEAEMQIKDQIEKGDIKAVGSSASNVDQGSPEEASDANAEDLGNPPTH